MLLDLFTYHNVVDRQYMTPSWNIYMVTCVLNCRLLYVFNEQGEGYCVRLYYTYSNQAAAMEDKCKNSHGTYDGIITYFMILT